MKVATLLKVRLSPSPGNANRPPAGARYKRAAILVVRLGEPMPRNANRPPASARYKRAAMLVVRSG